jgi:hypothetical protein
LLHLQVDVTGTEPYALFYGIGIALILKETCCKQTFNFQLNNFDCVADDFMGC